MPLPRIELGSHGPQPWIILGAAKTSELADFSAYPLNYEGTLKTNSKRFINIV